MIYDYICNKCGKKKSIKMTLEEYEISEIPECCGEEMMRKYFSPSLTNKLNGGQFKWEKE